MTEVNTPPVHAHSLAYLHLSLMLTHAAELPAVKRVLLAFCSTSYSAQCVCVSVSQCEGSRWRWVYNHGTVVVVFPLLLFHCCFYCSLNWGEEIETETKRMGRRKGAFPSSSPYFIIGLHSGARLSQLSGVAQQTLYVYFGSRRKDITRNLSIFMDSFTQTVTTPHP